MSQKIIDEKLALLKYKSDTNSHIEVDNEICATCKTKDCLNVCPAKVYKKDERPNILTNKILDVSK